MERPDSDRGDDTISAAEPKLEVTITAERLEAVRPWLIAAVVRKIRESEVCPWQKWPPLVIALAATWVLLPALKRLFGDVDEAEQRKSTVALIIASVIIPLIYLPFINWLIPKLRPSQAKSVRFFADWVIKRGKARTPFVIGYSFTPDAYRATSAALKIDKRIEARAIRLVYRGPLSYHVAMKAWYARVRPIHIGSDEIRAAFKRFFAAHEIPVVDLETPDDAAPSPPA
jgi:hypothetical protein